MPKKALIILADGFEEIEAVAVIDILRRARIEVTIAGLTQQIVTSSRNLQIKSEKLLSEVSSDIFDALILPGGEPGSTNLEKSALVRSMLIQHANAQKLVCAICGAPRVLHQAGLLTHKKATSFPGYEPQMPDCIYLTDRVVVDGNIITSRAAGTALEFAYKIVEMLAGKPISDQLMQGMLFIANTI